MCRIGGVWLPPRSTGRTGLTRGGRVRSRRVPPARTRRCPRRRRRRQWGDDGADGDAKSSVRSCRRRARARDRDCSGGRRIRQPHS